MSEKPKLISEPASYIKVPRNRHLDPFKRDTVGRGSEEHPPRHDDEEVKPVPCVAEVTFRAEDPQGHHLDDHLHREEGEDAVVQNLPAQYTHTHTNTHTHIHTHTHAKIGTTW